jgi:hypothetical protein
MIGAGTKSQTGGGDSDDWSFFDAWQVYDKRVIRQGADKNKPPKLIGEAILIEHSESASGLLYWDGKRFRWYQQGDKRSPLTPPSNKSSTAPASLG